MSMVFFVNHFPWGKFFSNSLLSFTSIFLVISSLPNKEEKKERKGKRKKYLTSITQSMTKREMIPRDILRTKTEYSH